MEQELSLVNQVEFRLLMAKGDAKFQQLLGVYLAPLLIKCDSPHSQVREKVQSICDHIDERIRSSSTQLPTDALLDQLLDQKYVNNEQMKTQNLKYLIKSLRVLSKEKRNSIIPTVLRCINQTSSGIHRAKLVYALLDLLSTYSPPERGTIAADNLRQTHGFDAMPELENLLRDKFIDIINITAGSTESQNGSTTLAVQYPVSFGIEEPSIQSILMPFGEERIGHLEIHEYKKSVINFLLASGFTDKNLYIPMLIASHASNSDFSDPAKQRFRQLEVDLEEGEVVTWLYRLALNPRANTDVRGHALQILCKSEKGLCYSPQEIIGQGITTFQGYTYFDSLLKFIDAVLKLDRHLIPDELAARVVEATQGTIKSQGWPRMNRNSSSNVVASEEKLRESCYRLIGLMMRHVPVVMRDQNCFRFLFGALEDDDHSVKMAIQDALFDAFPNFSVISSEQKAEIKEWLLRFLADSNKDQICKYVSVRFAARVAPFEDPSGRMLCLLGLYHENRSDVIEEAKRGLHPYWHRLITTGLFDKESQCLDLSSPFPKFQDMLQCIQSVEAALVSKFNFVTLKDLSPAIHEAVVKFLQQILAMEAAAEAKNQTILVIDESWESRLDTAVALDKGIRTAVRQYLKILDKNSINVFLDYAFQIVKNTGSREVADIWLRILMLSPSEIVVSNMKCVDDLIHLLDASKAHLRETAAHGLGIIATSDAYGNVEELVTKLTREVNESGNMSYDTKHGRILALGFIYSRLAMREKLDEEPEPVLELIVSWLKKSERRSGQLLEVQEAAVEAVFQLSMAKVLPPTENVMKDLSELAKAGSERAILTLGALSMADPSRSRTYIDTILEISDVKHVEFMFASGEAITISACGWQSTFTDRLIDIDGISLKSDQNDLEYTLEKVFQACKSTKPRLKKFGCLWLLSLTQYCSDMPEIQTNLRKIHSSFMPFLSISDEIVQESASRGLAIIYELGDENLRADLVRGLVQSFTSEKKVNAGQVSEDTELFEPGVLDTGDGSVSTYKDILNLASEVGDPSLVYKFMSLAAHSSLWASRRGAAFGLGSILSKANLDQVFESNNRFSKTLIPKLYRYRFDPNRNVRDSMRGIWDTLISDKAAAINDNFATILDELLKSMGEREWRVREASTNALSDLLQGRPIEKYQDRLEEIWKMGFRAVDDIKDSVRKAGMELTRGLTTTMVRNVDVESGASAKWASAILKEMIPFLIGNFGLQSDAEEVSQFALKTLLELCKKGGSALKPYIPMLIEELVNLMSTLEPQAMNYLSMNADKYGLTSEAIDASRMANLRSSPIMDSVDQMVDLLDDDLMKELVPRLVRLIKTSVGLPTKLGAARVLVILTLRRLHKIRPYADELLKACQSQLNNINDTVSQSYAMSAGYICRAASEQAVLNYEKSIEPLYFNSDNDRSRLISGHAVAAVAKHSSDKFDSVASAFLPFIFIAKHDSDKSVKDIFEHTWNDNTGGTGAVKLHLQEIIALCSHHLSTNQQWSIRQVAASSVADASAVIDVGDGKNLDELFEVLIEACKGRSWSGKELVLESLIKLSGRATEKLEQSPELFSRIQKLAITEAKRRNKDYQSKAIVSLGLFSKDFPSAEITEVLFEQSRPYLDPTYRNEEEEEEEEEEDLDEDGDVTIANSAQAIAKEEQRNIILKAVVGGYNDSKPSKEESRKVLEKLCNLIVSILQSADISSAKIAVTWRTKLCILQAVSELAKKLDSGAAGTMEPVWRSIMECCARDENHEKVRTESIRTGTVIMDHTGLDRVKTDFVSLKSTERSTVVLTELNKHI